MGNFDPGTGQGTMAVPDLDAGLYAVAAACVFFPTPEQFMASWDDGLVAAWNHGIECVEEGGEHCFPPGTAPSRTGGPAPLPAGWAGCRAVPYHDAITDSTTRPVTAATPATRAAPQPARSAADRGARCILRLDPDAPKASIFGAYNAFSSSIALSAVRCLITYVFVPLVGPVAGLTGGVGAWLGLALGFVSAAFIIYSVRRFFAADHKWRWAYGTIGTGLLVLLTIQAVIDIVRLAS